MQDSFEPDKFPYLGIKEKEQLKKLADLDGLSEEEEVKLLIQGRVRILERAWSAGELPKRAEVLKAKRIRIDKEASDTDEPHSSTHQDPSQ